MRGQTSAVHGSEGIRELLPDTTEDPPPPHRKTMPRVRAPGECGAAPGGHAAAPEAVPCGLGGHAAQVCIRALNLAGLPLGHLLGDVV